MNCKKYVLAFGLLLALTQCSRPGKSTQLYALFEEVWNFRLEENPLFATAAGYHQFDDRLPLIGVKNEERRANFSREVLQRLARIDTQTLNVQDQVSYEIFWRLQEERVAAFEHETYWIPFNVDSGFHISFARLPRRVPLSTVQDYENYVARLRGFSAYVDQHIDLLREAYQKSVTLPRIVMEGYEVPIESHIVGDVEESIFYVPFVEFPPSIPATEHARLKEVGARAIREHVVPGYQAFLDFMVNEYIPNARSTVGASDLPMGLKYYAYLIRHFTTVDISAEEIHRLGLQEVERIRSEMMDVIEELKFSGSFADFLKFLRTDERFYPKTPDQLLKEASFIAKRMDGKLPLLFKTLPRLPYGIVPVPHDLAPKYTGGRYIRAPLGSNQPGYYWVNTYALESRPLYVLEALTLHESVPGHHLQNALQQELQGLPNFRRFTNFTAFGEGWGLYSERLGLEAGFYRDPYSNFGRLTYEMWRACRLVVDSGLHALGWSRDQAMDFLAENTALSLHEIRTETDRYIAWPGQALAYKIGELKILELRRRAEETLGEKFDVREFHDAVLENGSLPLPVLETQIEKYIRNKQGALY